MTVVLDRVRLGEVACVRHGYAFQGAYFVDRPTKYVLLTPGNFHVGGGFKSDKLKFYDGPVPDEYVLSPGTLVVTMTDLSKNMDTLGYPALVPELPDGRIALHNQRIGLVDVTSPSVDKQWLFYRLRGSDYRSEVLASSSGTTVHHTSPSRIERFEFELPPLAEQRAMAATLGALDDKIESNRRAIDVLQRLSSAIFARWRSAVVAVTSSTFSAYADIYGGATPKTTVPDYWGGDLAWTTPTDVTAISAPYLFKTSRTITDEGLQSCTAVMHPVGTIFMTSRATIGAFAINQIPAATNQGFIAVRPRQDADRYFLFEEMRSRVDEFLDNANGSTFLEISRGRFKELSLEIPGPEDLARLDEQVKPLHQKAAQLALESDRLAALRDALLPELLSGRIRVPVKGVAA